MSEDFTLWLEFEHWEQLPHHDLEDDFFNMNIFMSDGTVYALTV